jgi:uncharacterized protein (DUF924 family)
LILYNRHMHSGDSYEDVLKFWFSEPVREHWFKPSEAIDQDIAQRFGALHRRAAGGELDDWARNPRSALALVIVLDQFSRNLCRGKPATYANDEHALRIARAAIVRGFDQYLDGWEKAFLYMPYMHSERLEIQEESVRLFTTANLDNAPYALHHRDIVRRFGRFPHRNATLGRESTPEEREYLESDSAFRG